jgi:uncharacterized protein (AIM24 family)
LPIAVRPPEAPERIGTGAGPESLTAFLDHRVVRTRSERTFVIAAEQALVIRIKGRVFARTAGVLVTGGQLAFEAVQRKTRGRPTGETFGAGEAAMCLVSGTGQLVALPRGGVFALVQLADEVLYLREDLLHAFEEQLSWENGHVPGSNGTLPVVQLRGEGALAVRSQRALLGVEVESGRVLRLPAAALAGWTAGVVPRIGGGEPATIECAGEGAVLVEEPRP